MRKLFTLTILCIALAAGLYTQRMDVMDWYRNVTTPELPESVAYEEVVENVGVVEEESPSVESDLSDPVAKETGEVIEEQEPSVDDPIQEPSVDEPVEEEATLPVSMNLAVPFTSQAPQGNWDEPYQEACEEASVYMVHAYFTGIDEGKIPADTAQQDLLKMVEFEMELYGYYKDTTVEQTGMFVELMYGHTYQVLRDPTVEEIKRKLVQGHPVIVPAAGRLLGNPYFTAPGPLYHMLVIRGYTQDGQFIVNDPGTSRGEAYLYDFDTIMNAMHDWNEGGEITQGGKVVLVLSP